jgi:hypothetical protein
LQHIPVVGTIYREITGDVMKPISSILGGALFGGVIGLAASAVDAIIQETTGEDVGAHIMATLGLHHDPKATTQVASPGSTPQVTTSKAGAPVIKPVPALLVAEAEADRRAHGQMPSGGMTAIPIARAAAAPAAGPGPAALPASATGAIGTLQPTGFWRSLQRGGAGVTHAGPPAPPTVGINPSKALLDAASAAKAPPAKVAPAVQPAPASSAPTPIVPATPVASAPQPVAANVTPAAGTPSADAMMASADPQPLPRAAIPGMMMEALAKYEAMHKAPQAQAVDQVH